MNMSEIKFRVRNLKEEKFEDLKFITLVYDDKGIEVYTNDGYVLENYEINQYTGLKDKNGVEICEGDIVKTKRASNIKGYVTMYQGAWCICHYYTYYKLFYNFADAEPIEIIGNIYDDKELLIK